MVRVMLVLGAVLSRTVVAERIATAAHLEQLRAMGSLYGQGRHLLAPMDAASAARLIDASTQRAA